MKMTIQVVIEDGDTTPQAAATKVISLERNVEDLGPSTLGLKLDEAKAILAEVQTTLVTAQATCFQERQCSCPDCGAPYQKNGTHQLTFRTLFGTIKLANQRLYTCSCQRAKVPQHTNKPISFSPLAKFLPERSAPEFVYLQAKWAAVMSYGRTAQLLE